MEFSENPLNIKVSTTSLLRYAFPTILSNTFMNVYSIVDQLFASNLLGTDALSDISIAGLFLAVALVIGMMIATGAVHWFPAKWGKRKWKKHGKIFRFLCC